VQYRQIAYMSLLTERKNFGVGSTINMPLLRSEEMTFASASDAVRAGGLYKNCPKVDEILAKSGRKNATVQSNVVKLTTEQDVYEVELTLPSPRCEKAKE